MSEGAPPAKAAPETSSGSAAASNGGGSRRLLIGGGILLLLNVVFNNFLADSGLHVSISTATLKAGPSNVTAVDDFRAFAEHTSTSLKDPSDSSALRFELMQLRNVQSDGSGAATFAAWQIHWQRPETVGLPAWLTTELTPSQPVRRFVTVFPERSRWREATPHVEPGELGEVGRVSLLVQLSTLRVPTTEAEGVRRGWPDLGYNALGEAGVVRCDLIEEASNDGEATTTFVARKVFRNSLALRAHEDSEHFQRWREATQPLLVGGAVETQLLDTLHPRSSPFPFRSRW